MLPALIGKIHLHIWFAVPKCDGCKCTQKLGAHYTVKKYFKTYKAFVSDDLWKGI